ncbi:uncharacterized protein LOC106659474 [Trichogramma pretiosum]|uniref:uncharacterized protein LOC106659474 n=1 Tax=Trichogramma pretiosum TaxID=7493 RepID=UPI000C71B4D1|nr:uncharacterized protein LOC106659474 [Trichogramma pretiosum]
MTKDPRASDIQHFEWAFGLNRFVFGLMGVWPKKRPNDDSNSNSSFMSTNVLVIPGMIVLLVGGLIAPQMYALSRIYDDFTLVIDNLTTVNPCVCAVMMLYFLWSNRDSVARITKIIELDWLRDVQRSPGERLTMLRYAGYGRTFTLSGCFITIFAVLCFVVTPFLGLSFRLINNRTDQVGRRRIHLPLQSVYPGDYLRSPYYELCYAAQMLGGCIVGMTIAATDNFFAALTFHASARCRVLAERMAGLALIGIAREEEFFRALGASIREHVRIIRLVRTIERIFNQLLLTKLICMPLVVCFVGLELIGSFGSESIRLTTLFAQVGALVTMVFHALIDCVACEVLMKYEHQPSRLRFRVVRFTRALCEMLHSDSHTAQVSAETYGW